MADSATPANGSSGASAAVSPDAGRSSTGQLCLNGCGREANSKLNCPVCLKNNIKGARFCTPDCFRDNYREHHRKMHVSASTTPVDSYVYPEGTEEPFLQDPKKNRYFAYSGSLRAVYPKEMPPKREVPEHIPKPDYATEKEGRSFSEAMDNRAVRMGRTKQGKILSKEEQEGMRKVCKLAREVLDIAAAAIRPGITTLEIDAIVHEECLKRDSYPSPLNYNMFPRSVCTSINEVICHGIPDARPLVDGDIINLDVTLFHGGFHGDINGTYPVGPSVSQENLDLIACSRECLDESIRMCKPGTQYQDIGRKIEEIAFKRGFSSNKTYVGHGIHQLFHPCLPTIPHYAGNKAPGIMKVGQTFTIEPMICVGQQKEIHWPDNWTAATVDGKSSAQFEETLLITPDGVEVLTAAPGWTLPEKGVEAEPLETTVPSTGPAKKKKGKKGKQTIASLLA
ncbi:hypothetical protein JCM11641_000644 [Rhodosporidiobolus odoratus]